MHKKALFILLALFLVGVLLGGIGLARKLRENPVSAPLASPGEAAGTREGTLEPEEFHNVDLSILAGDVILRRGEGFSLDYRLHPREQVVEAEVRDDTLYFSTKGTGGVSLDLDFDDLRVVLTIPREIRLEQVRLTTVSGDVEVTDFTFTSLAASSTSGDLELSQVESSTMNLKTVSGDLELEVCHASSLTAETTSGELSLAGSWGTVEAKTVSGSCDLEGTVAEQATLETVSGDLEVELNHSAGVSAASVGGVTWNDAPQGRELNLPLEGPQLTLKSVSGKIEVDVP